MVIYGDMLDNKRSIYEKNTRTTGINFYMKRMYKKENIYN